MSTVTPYRCQPLSSGPKSVTETRITDPWVVLHDQARQTRSAAEHIDQLAARLLEHQLLEGGPLTSRLAELLGRPSHISPPTVAGNSSGLNVGLYPSSGSSAGGGILWFAFIRSSLSAASATTGAAFCLGKEVLDLDAKNLGEPLGRTQLRDVLPPLESPDRDPCQVGALG